LQKVWQRHKFVRRGSKAVIFNKSWRYNSLIIMRSYFYCQNRQIIKILLCFFLLQPCFTYAKTPVVALVDFSLKGLDEKTANHFIERVGSNLSSNEWVNVIIHSEIESVLMDIGLQQEKCKTTECLIKAGKLMEISHIVMGTIKKQANVYTVEVEIIVVDSAKVKKIESTVCIDCDSQNFVLAVSGTVSARISEKIQDNRILEKMLTENTSPEKKALPAKKTAATGGQPFFKNSWIYVGFAAITTGTVAAYIILNQHNTVVKETSSGTLIIE